MSSNLVPMVLSDVFQRRRDREQYQRQLEVIGRDERFQREMANLQIGQQVQLNAIRFSQEAILAAMQGFTTAMEQAKTPEEVATAMKVFNKTTKTLTKDNPSGPLELFSETDISNAKDLLGKRPEIMSHLEQITFDAIVGMNEGKLTLGDARNQFTSDLADLSKRYGEEDVLPLSGEFRGALIQAYDKRQEMVRAEIGLRSQTMGILSQFIGMLPDASSLVVDMQTKLESMAMADALQRWGISSPNPADPMTAQRFIMAGQNKLYPNKKVDQLSQSASSEALTNGYDQFLREVEDRKANISHRFWGQTLPAISKMAETNVDKAKQMFVEMYNLTSGPGGNRISVDAFKALGLDEEAMQLAEKYSTPDGPNTDTDRVQFTNALDGLRASGMLGRDFQEMTNEEFDTAVQSGEVDDVLKRIKGPGGTSLRDLLVDESGRVVPHPERVLQLDQKALAAGDPATWSVAKWWATSSNPTDLVAPDGMGPSEAIVRALGRGETTTPWWVGVNPSGRDPNLPEGADKISSAWLLDAQKADKSLKSDGDVGGMRQYFDAWFQNVSADSAANLDSATRDYLRSVKRGREMGVSFKDRARTIAENSATRLVGKTLATDEEQKAAAGAAKTGAAAPVPSRTVPVSLVAPDTSFAIGAGDSIARIGATPITPKLGG